MAGDDYPDFDAGIELYCRFLGGDESAFAELIMLYRDSLTGYIRCFVSDSREAEELMIDTFAELAANTKYSGKSSLKAYLFSIGRHLALRHVKRYRAANFTPIHDMMGEPMIGESTLEDDFLRGEQKERLHSAMRTLKPDYCNVLYLIYFENMSYADAGEIMGKTEKQVANLLYRAKASLKKTLGREEAGI